MFVNMSCVSKDLLINDMIITLCLKCLDYLSSQSNDVENVINGLVLNNWKKCTAEADIA